MLRTTMEFVGTPTTEEERKILAEAGFVHITGLQAYDTRGNPSYIVGDRLEEKDLGKHDSNNGKIVIVTIRGEVWIKACARNAVSNAASIICRFAPNGQGAFVPLSNGETVEQHKLLQRVSDPSDGLVAVK